MSAIVKVKICGITRPEDARMCEEAGTDAVAVNFVPSSKRYVEVDRGKEILNALGPFTQRVAVFMNADINEVLETATSLMLDIVQLHGNEDTDYIEQVRKHFKVIKAIGVKNDIDGDYLAYLRNIPADGLLIDGVTPGSGDVFDWSKAEALSGLPNLILAGGLTPDNVIAGIKALRPYAVDVASGVEVDKSSTNDPQNFANTNYPTKDFRKVQDFVRAAKSI